jgi:hypothetical protein
MLRINALKTLVIAAALAATLAGSAYACDPPDAGDQYQMKNGQAFEIVKVNSATCHFKFCVRPAGSKQNCRWIKDPRFGPGGVWTGDDITWIIDHGVKQ